MLRKQIYICSAIQCKLKSLNKDLNCYKNFDNLSCIYLPLTNPGKSLKSTNKEICVNISGKDKRNHEYLELKDFTGNKYFGATVKSIFSNKIKSTEYITLDENGKIVIRD